MSQILTPRRSAREPRNKGSPAHAGMDPLPFVSGCLMHWLPRTRGDGPQLYLAILALIPAPPHTRGWTPRMPEYSAARSGSPAHAGMDPSVPTGTVTSGGLPRTRGDGPYGTNCDNDETQAPPHTRGWTRHPIIPAHHGPGSPAHAGMDRSAAGASARDLVREKGPRSLLAAPSTLPETASASSRAVGPPAAARPESPRRSPAITGSAAGRDPHRTN
jgi:hypothetical protein